MIESITLIKDGGGRSVKLATLRSIGQSEFYQAAATDYRPEMKFILSDYYDYDGEVYLLWRGELYRIIRTYRAGQEMELTVGKASAEERAIYGKADD